jgi:O-antigen ligase
MFQANWLKLIPYYLLCLVAFLLSFPFLCAAIGIIILTFFWLLQCNFRELVRNIWHRKALWPFIIFYILHGISYFYSADKGSSLFDLQAKLSFIILPIIVGAGLNLDLIKLERVIFWFINGIFSMAVFCLCRALYIWVNSGTTSQFYYHQLVANLDANAVYYSWYSIVAIAALIFFPFKKHYIKQSVFKTATTFILIIFIILLSSKTLIALFILLIIPIWITRLYSKKQSIITPVVVTILISTGVVILLNTNNPVKKRYLEIFNHENTITLTLKTNPGSKDTAVQKKIYNNLTIRLFIWRVAFENIRQHNLWYYGCGNGDLEHLQNDKMAEDGIADIFNPQARSPLYNINIHNMYIETLMMIGVPGLIILIIILTIPFLYIRRTEAYIFFLIFFLSSLLFMFQEAALQTQAGIVYYTYVYSLFFSYYYYSVKAFVKR